MTSSLLRNLRIAAVALVIAASLAVAALVRWYERRRASRQLQQAKDGI